MTLSNVQVRAAQQQVLGRRPLAPVPPPLTRRMHCCDVSNYTAGLTTEALLAWKGQHDIGLVIVQAIDPPPAFPAGKTRQQIETCAAGNVPTDAYVYLWVNSNVEQDMRSKLALLNGLEHLVGRMWIDIEDTSPASVAGREMAIRQALAVTDGWCSAHGKPRTGIYTGEWWWRGYLGNPTEFGDRELWASQYDGIEDVSVFTPFGGWSKCSIKQYRGSSTLAGVTGVDLNILS